MSSQHIPAASDIAGSPMPGCRTMAAAAGVSGMAAPRRHPDAASSDVAGTTRRHRGPATLAAAGTTGRHHEVTVAGRSAALASAAVPPLQWWRRLPAEAFTLEHVATLRRAFAGIGMVGEPRWAEAVRGCPAAAVEVALRVINAPGTPAPCLDLTMSIVLVAALAGDATATALLSLMIARMAAKADRRRLLSSWRGRCCPSPTAAGKGRGRV